jgi:transposase InsO family protein
MSKVFGVSGVIGTDIRFEDRPSMSPGILTTWEWARGLTYRSSTDRRAALPHWLDHYNRARRHSALGNRPPLARVREVLGHDI